MMAARPPKEALLATAAPVKAVVEADATPVPAAVPEAAEVTVPLE